MGKQKEKERAKECEKEKLPPKSKSTKKSPPPSPIFRTSSSTSSTTRLFRPTTPPPRPCTPPRRPGTSIQLSPQRTPISHRGLHMSPSPSLAHYKNNLDPPPPVASVFLPQAPLLCGGVVSQGAVVLPSPEVLRTPKRKGGRVSIGSAGKGMSIGALVDPGTFAPVTPKRVFSSSTSSSSNLSHSNPHSRSSKSSASSTLHESASSTSTGVSTQLSPATWDSPFRTTPSKMQIFDPHDPGTLLDDEVMRLGTQQDMSPCGSGIGRERGLLYESPSLDGVGWERYW